MVRIAGFGAALPGAPIKQSDLWEGFFHDHFGGSRGARRIFGNAGVATRYGVANPLVDDVSATTTEHRMRRYARDAPPRGRTAVVHRPHGLLRRPPRPGCGQRLRGQPGPSRGAALPGVADAARTAADPGGAADRRARAVRRRRD